MKNVFEKIAEKFKEIGDIRFNSFSKMLIPVEDAINIVNEVATEYNNGWIPVTERMPESEPLDDVLVTWIPSWSKTSRLISTAVYVEEHSVTTDDMDWHDDCYDDLEYSETLDTYWIPIGWYETVINSVDDIGYMPIEGTVVAWQPLPEPYKIQQEKEKM